MSQNSPFVHNLEAQIKRIKEIIKSPKLVDDKFEDLLNIHNSLLKLANDYVSSTASKIKEEVKTALAPKLQNYKTSYKSDILKLDELNKTVLNNSTNFKFKTLKNNLSILFNDFTPELFDNSIYYELDEYVDTSITAKSVNALTPEQKEMIKNYKSIKDEIENGLDDFVVDIKNFEKHAISIRDNEIKRGMSVLDSLYVIHLNYLKAYSKNKNVDYTDYKLNGRVIDKFGKQSEFLNRYLED